MCRRITSIAQSDRFIVWNMKNRFRNGRTDAAKIALLRRVPALRSCSDAQLAKIAPLVDEFRLEEGREILREGAFGYEAFVIVEGWAAVLVGDEPVAALGPGEFIGEVAMLDNGRRTATVVAKTPMVVLNIGPRVFASFAAQPAVARALTRNLAERLRQADAARSPKG